MSVLRLSKSVLGQEESQAVSDVILRDGYLGMGKEVMAFETDLARYLDVSSQCVSCVNTGTAALHLALQAALNPGDEVLVQSLTYVASFQAITAAGMIPVACEVDPRTITIDLNDAKKRLTKNTKAIMPVHYASNPGKLDEIYAFAKKHGLRVVEDAAHAFGCIYQGRKIGSFGDIVCFSFDGIKNITSGEGGAVVTKDVQISSKVKETRLLGVLGDTEKRFAGERSWEFDVKRQGYRYHMSNLMAAIGRVQLRRLDNEFAPKRRQLLEGYHNCLKSISGIGLLDYDPDFIVPHIMPLRVLNHLRDKLKKYLAENDVETGVHYKPNHLLAYYGSGAVSLPTTEKLYEELLSLPLHPELDINDVKRITGMIKQFLSESEEDVL
jgi:dTDP-4-amino-4,6-dideoxygalactose transaminase